MHSFNWVDIILICVFLRGIYVAQKSGLLAEIFKLIGVFFAALLSCHYYERFGIFLHKKIALPEATGEVLSFSLLAIIIILVFALIREAWLVILKLEVKNFVNEWVSLAASILHCVLLSGLVVIALIVGGNKFVSDSAKFSFTGGFFKDTVITVYRGCYEGVLKTLFPEEPVNSKLLRLANKPLNRDED